MRAGAEALTLALSDSGRNREVHMTRGKTPDPPGVRPTTNKTNGPDIETQTESVGKQLMLRAISYPP